MKVSGEDKHKSLGLTISIVIHAILLLLFFFIVAWREPNPPIPEYGIELSFGVPIKGSSSTAKKVSAPNSSDSKEEVREEVPEQEQEPVQQEQTSQPVEPQEEFAEESTSETNDNPSESEVTEPTKETQVEPKPIKQTEQSTSIKKGVGNDGEDETDSPDKNNETKESSGNKGTEKIDKRALYGKKEGTSKQGSFLNIKGWAWDGKPRPNDTSNENGKIVFQITIDDRGDIIGVKTIESTVTPTVEKIYKDEVSKLTFSPTSDNFSPAPVSKGEITFVIRSK